MVPISLNSNLSYESLQLIPVSVGNSNIDFQLRINGQHWDGDHEHAIRLSSESIVVSCDRLRLLVDNVQTWLESIALWRSLANIHLLTIQQMQNSI